LRLDYNQDGKVDVQDFRKSVQELYNFVVNYNYYLTAHEIKNKLYHEAIKYMQKELDKDEKEKESHVDENS
jgi:Ca2+-binding EF-hand superfamily protein